MAATVELHIAQGKTLEFALLWADAALRWRPIAAITALAPVTLSVPEHGLVDDWPVHALGADAPAELNTLSIRPRPRVGDYCCDDTGRTPYIVDVVDADTLALRNVQGLAWEEYVGAGHIQFNQPADVAGYRARAAFRDTAGRRVLTLASENDPMYGDDGEIIVDAAGHRFVLVVPASVTERLDVTEGVWDMEVEAPDGRVFAAVALSRFVVGEEIARE